MITKLSFLKTIFHYSLIQLNWALNILPLRVTPSSYPPKIQYLSFTFLHSYTLISFC